MAERSFNIHICCCVVHVLATAQNRQQDQQQKIDSSSPRMSGWEVLEPDYCWRYCLHEEWRTSSSKSDCELLLLLACRTIQYDTVD